MMNIVRRWSFRRPGIHLMRRYVSSGQEELYRPIHPLLLKRAELMEKEYDELSQEMNEKLGSFSQESNVRLSNLSVILENYEQYKHDIKNLEGLKEMIEDPEGDSELAEESMKELQAMLPNFNESINVLQTRLLPSLPHSDKPALIELRPGVGGHEAGIFTSDLKSMYTNFAQYNKWKWQIISENFANNGYCNECIISIDSPEAYNILRHESGVHRVQRIPLTESKGRIHTSTAAVVVLPKISTGTEASLKEDERQFAPGEVRVDTMRAGGKGGQHVNTTDSAVRLVHIPTGTTVQQQDERSQPRNKAKAFLILRSRLAALEREKEILEQRKLRTDQVTTTDRSDKIRTYNYPQNRITDHRCGYSMHDIEGCMLGVRLMDIIAKVEQHEFEERLQLLIASASN